MNTISLQMKKIIGVFVFLASTSLMQAQTTLPNYFSDSMVLQQQTDAVIWGNDKPKTNITINASWGSSSKAVTDENGHWRLKLKTPAAGGPFKVEITGTSKIVYQNVLVGEVWLCSGQSNMEMPVKGYNNQPIENSNEVILNSYNPYIRVFTSPRQFSQTAANNVNGYWRYACSENTGSFSATAYFFVKKIQSILKVPVGLIVNAWGGASVESWMDSSTLATYKKVEIPATMVYNQIHQIHTILYKSMIHPCKGYTIKGAIWYQGEGNRKNTSEYQALFSLMIQSWREQWQQGNFPFYFVQIAPIGPNSNITVALLREAQLKTMQSVENTGMAVTLDIGEESVIHPAQKELVGNRLAFGLLLKTITLMESNTAALCMIKLKKLVVIVLLFLLSMQKWG